MHPIATRLPVGSLITPSTIIIASITQPDRMGEQDKKDIQQCELGEWGIERRTKRQTIEEEDKETDVEDATKTIYHRAW